MSSLVDQGTQFAQDQIRQAEAYSVLVGENKLTNGFSGGALPGGLSGGFSFGTGGFNPMLLIAGVLAVVAIFALKK